MIGLRIQSDCACFTYTQCQIHYEARIATHADLPNALSSLSTGRCYFLGEALAIRIQNEKCWQIVSGVTCYHKTKTISQNSDTRKRTC